MSGQYYLRLFCLLCILLRISFARAADHPVRYLGIEQGLSNNAVTTIYQDKQGFMWFGTYDGLNRYDGYQFKVYRNKVGDPASLTGNSIYTLAGDVSDNIWVGGQKGLCRLDAKRSRFTRLQYGAAKPVLDDIHTVQPLRNGQVLVGTNHLGLIIYEKDSITGNQVVLPGIGITAYDVTAVEEGDTGAWVFVQQHGLYKYDKGKLQLVNDSITIANSLRRSKDGHLWLGNENGLFEYDPIRNSYSGNRLASRSKVVQIREDRNGLLWLCSDGGGLLVMNKTDAQAKPFLNDEGKPVINSNAVYAIYEDTDGRKWVGTLRGGVNTIEANPEAFRRINTTRSSPASDFILSFAEDKQHNVWIGTDGAGLRYWDRQQNSFTDYVRGDAPTALSSNFITGLVCDANDQTWIATWFGGINRFTKKGFTRYNCYNPVSKAYENNVWVLCIDQQQRLWAGATNDGSLYLYNTTADKFELFDHNVRNLQCLTEDKAGNLWGGNYNALIKIDPVNKRHITWHIGYTLRSIHEDSKNRLWIGTQEGGLLLFDRKQGNYRRFTTNEGLASNTILRILEDSHGELWLSSFNGLTKFNPEKNSFRNFYQSDGLQSNQFSFNAALVLSSGELAFGGIRGFNVFYPDSIHDQVHVPPLFLNGVSVDNKTVNVSKEVVMPFDQGVLSISYLALDYSGADNNSYAYYLDGWDKSWNYVNTIRTANYSHLHEGRYTFMVKVRTKDGQWHAGTTLLQVTVLPPWYRTWWAYTLYALTLVLLIYLYVTYSRRQERLKYEIRLAHMENDLNEKKLSFFTYISHEFRSPLSLIINPLKDVIKKKEGSTDLNIAYRNARRLLSLVDQLLLFRKADSGADKLKIASTDIVHLCVEVYQCFLQQAGARNIHYRFHAPDAPVILAVDAEKIEIALFNLLSNAFKYTPDGGAIDFEVKGTIITISDTGCGIDKAEQERIFEKFQQSTTHTKAGFGIGLYLVKHFIESHQGRIAVQSELNKGTVFTITLPVSTHTAHMPVEESHTHELLDELKEEPYPAEDNLPLFTDQGKTADEVVTEKKSILLVDDDQEIREYLKHLFGDKYVLYTASNGQSALEMAEQHAPDLIISDINMERMDGVELCRRVKLSSTIGHIPVILLTASAGADVKLKGIEGGADDYITKPFDSTLLQARVDTILKNRNLLQRYFFENITLQESALKVPAEYRDFLRACIKVVEENLDTEDFTIQKFCKSMGMSRSSLYQKVKHISGQSLNAFIRSIRLRRAAVLMIRENMNVNQAAFQVGIGDARYFRQQFVKLFGMTPSEYIKKYRSSFSGDMNLIRPPE